MIRNGMARKITHQQEKAKEADDIEHLKQRWLLYPPSIQEMLNIHLHHYGVHAAQSTTDILASYTKSLRDSFLGETEE